MNYNTPNLNNKLLTWIEFTWLERNVHDYDPAIGMTRYEGLCTGISHWSRITDTIVVSGNAKNFPELYDWLARDFPELTFVPSMKISQFTGGTGNNDIFNSAKWATMVPYMEERLAKTGQTSIIIDSETGTNDYKALTYKEFQNIFNEKGLSDGLAQFPNDIDYVWYRSSYSGSSDQFYNFSQTLLDIFGVVYDTLGCDSVSLNETHPYSRNLIWEQQIAEQIEAIAPKNTWWPLIFFLSNTVQTTGDSTKVWVAPPLDVNQLIEPLEEYRKSLLYPGLRNFVLDPHQLVDSIEAHLQPELPKKVGGGYAMQFKTTCPPGTTRTRWKVYGPKGAQIYFSGQNPSSSSEVMDAKQIDRITLRLDYATGYEVVTDYTTEYIIET